MSDQIDVNAIADVLNNKMDLDMGNLPAGIDYVVQSKFPTDSDPTWYRLYRSGWVEQGGVYILPNNTATNVQITFPITMGGTNYCVTLGCGETDNNTSAFLHYNTRSTTGMYLYINPTANGRLVGSCWEVKGMSAQGGN